MNTLSLGNAVQSRVFRLTMLMLGLTVVGSATPIISAVVNGASFLNTGLAPGEYMSVFGTDLSASLVQCAALTSCGGTSILIGGSAAPITLASPGQLIFVVPWGIAGSSTNVQVNNAGNLSNSVAKSVVASAPGVFTQTQTGSGAGAFLNGQSAIITSANPAIPGQTIIAYVTGLGAVTPTVADGVVSPSTPLSQTNGIVTATVGGVAATVLFAGLSPGYVALNQVTFIVPTGLSGNQNFVVTVNGVSSQSGVTLPVATPEPSSLLLLIGALVPSIIVSRFARRAAC